jgi:hypothetical protein
MSIRGLNEVVGKAIISDNFRAGLLNGKRAEMLRQFEDKLDPEERQALLGIQAEAFSDFAAAIEQLIDQREGRRISSPVSTGERVALPAVGWSNLVSNGAYLHHG